MGIEAQFSSGYGRRDQGPNRELASSIAAGQNYDAVSEIFGLFEKKMTARQLNDAVLTLAAVSSEAPEMLRNHVDELADLLNSKVNRQIFGSMIALANVSYLVPEKLQPYLSLILDAMDSGTVVTRDHGFTILTQLYKIDRSNMLLPLILEQLMKAPPNQLGQYTEKFISVMKYEHREELARVLEDRMEELESPNHRQRLSKNLKKITGQ